MTQTCLPSTGPRRSASWAAPRYFGSETCSQPNPQADLFQQLWQPYNYGTAVATVDPVQSWTQGSAWEFSLARDIGAAIDIEVSGATVYRAWGELLIGAGWFSDVRFPTIKIENGRGRKASSSRFLPRTVGAFTLRTGGTALA